MSWGSVVRGMRTDSRQWPSNGLVPLVFGDGHQRMLDIKNNTVFSVMCEGGL